VNKFHKMTVHCGIERLKKTANIHGLKFKEEFNVYEECAVAKARHRNLNQYWKERSQVSGKIVYLDISSINGENYYSSHFWALVIDDYKDIVGVCFKVKHLFERQIHNLTHGFEDIENSDPIY
jgi:hypothetical protein